MKNKYLIFVASVFLTACGEEQCVVFLNDKMNAAEGVSLVYSVVMEQTLQQFETSHSYSNRRSLGVSGVDGKVCFSFSSISDLEDRALATMWYMEKGGVSIPIGEKDIKFSEYIIFSNKKRL